MRLHEGKVVTQQSDERILSYAHHAVKGQIIAESVNDTLDAVGQHAPRQTTEALCMKRRAPSTDGELTQQTGVIAASTSEEWFAAYAWDICSGYTHT